MLRPRRGGVLERVSREEWNIGIIAQTAEDIVQRGIVEPVRWLAPMHPWYGLADPACHVAPDGTRFLFAEQLKHLDGRGEIWKAFVPPGVDLIHAKFRPYAVGSIHLSYPFPIFGDDMYRTMEIKLTMESGDAGKLYLWRRREGIWTRTELLDRPAIDPTIWHGDTHWWLFCTFADDEPDKNLHLFYADQVEGPWQPHPRNPIKTDLATARPAGPLFRAGGRLIRPSQDSTQSYGSAVVLNTILALTPTSYREQPVRRLTPQLPYPDGLHTICPAGDSTMIDGKRWGFNLLDPARYLMVGTLKRIRRWRQRPVTVCFHEVRGRQTI